MTGARCAVQGVLVALVVLLAGCAALQERDRVEPDDVPSEEPGATIPDDAQAPAWEAAVRDLMAEAQQASDDGDHERAGALLERALRIAPENAVLWHNLAVVRYREDALDQAESMAQRSVSYAGDNIELQRRNWEIIAVSRYLRGDEDGADAARRRAEGLQEAGGE
ncbi:tetratricopeptide repeat protein [Aquisalimonas sp.]|uniref:tetratricopeptide repeat protein n=1 Tax=Aquisalimonas sp. TaxID=1872621 RepID=UPI0025BC6FA1|nr:tetratricopeptide repeat protein [Aquisalimonas sp.]